MLGPASSTIEIETDLSETPAPLGPIPAGKTAARILALFRRYGNKWGEAEAGASENTGPHFHKIAAAVSARKRIEIILPAFPAKSANREKTLGDLPDFAEVLGLSRLDRLCAEIGRLHAPGARVTICSDGRVFSDLVLVRDEDVTRYQNAIDALITEFSLTRLRTLHMDDVFPELSHGEMREALVRTHARPLGEIRESVRADSEARFLFNGIHRFLFEDRLALVPGKSRNRIREETKLLAYEVIQRSNSWSGLVESIFPEAVRLSIHPQPSRSAKLGIQLVEAGDGWATPWHNVAFRDKSGFRLMKRREAEARGAELVYHLGKYPYFRAAGDLL